MSAQESSALGRKRNITCVLVSLAVIVACSSTVSAVSSSPLAIDLVQSFRRIAAQPDVAKFLAGRPPADDNKLIFDVGINDGRDSRHFSNLGFTVVGVDANPQYVASGKEQFRDLVEAHRMVLVHAGIEESTSSADLVFWKNLKHPVLSSFEKEKACGQGEQLPGGMDMTCEKVDVPLMRCEALWIFGRPFYLKVDIEERHYACIQALRNLPHDLLPPYVSWELHEFARAKQYPIIDAQLILLLSELGYDGVKYVLQENANESAGVPEDAINYLTGAADWTSISDALRAGLINPRDLGVQEYDHKLRKNVTLTYPWFDFHMRLGAAGVGGGATAHRHHRN